MGDAITPMSQFRSDIAKLKPEFQMAMPPGFDADRMARMCITVVNQNPGLLDCTRKSLLGAMMTAAQLGLDPAEWDDGIRVNSEEEYYDALDKQEGSE